MELFYGTSLNPYTHHGAVESFACAFTKSSAEPSKTRRSMAFIPRSRLLSHLLVSAI